MTEEEHQALKADIAKREMLRKQWVDAMLVVSERAAVKSEHGCVVDYDGSFRKAVARLREAQSAYFGPDWSARSVAVSKEVEEIRTQGGDG